MALRFLVHPNARLQDRAPIQVLKDEERPLAKRKAQVLEAARAIRDHGAD